MLCTMLQKSQNRTKYSCDSFREVGSQICTVFEDTNLTISAFATCLTERAVSCPEFVSADLQGSASVGSHNLNCFRRNFEIRSPYFVRICILCKFFHVANRNNVVCD